MRELAAGRQWEGPRAIRPSVFPFTHERYIGVFQTSFITRSQFSPMTKAISESE